MVLRYAGPLIGRQREMALIRECYEGARQGHTHVALVAGEPGIGKTRLLDEISRGARQDGVIVLRGGSSEAEGMPPYQPFLEALAQYIQDIPGEQVREQMAAVPHAHLLTSLLPELAVSLEAFPTPLSIVPEQARFRLYEAVGKFLEVIGMAHALVLVLDDLHWADTASLDLLCHIVRRQQRARMLIIGAYRDSELELHPALMHTIAECSRQRVLTAVAMMPLSDKETAMLACAHLGCACSAEVSLLLHRQCEGNPFFTEELLDGWMEMGVLVQKNNLYSGISPHPHRLPPNLVAAVRQRFAHLPSESIDHLRVAAIIGRTFDLSLLAAVKQQGVEAVEESLRAAEQARLVHTEREGCFVFNHDTIRECLYSEVSTARRRRLHGVIGHILESVYTSESLMTLPQLNELAFHFARNDDQERGIDYSLRAAAQVQQAFAFEEAMSHYQVALGLLGPDDQRSGDIEYRLGTVALLANKEEQAEMAFARAQQWFERRGESEAAARAAHGLGQAQWRQEKRAEAYTSLQQALALLAGQQCAEAGEILLDLAVLLMVFMESYDEGTAYAQQALEMACALDDTRLQTIARRVLAGNISIQASLLPVALQSLEPLLAQAERSGDLLEAAESSLYLSCGYYWLAQLRRSLEVSGHMIELMKHSHQSFQLRHAYSWQALLFTSQGKWIEAEQMLALAQPVVDQLSSPLPFTFLCQIRGFLAYQQEDYPTAERELQAAMIGQDQYVSLGESSFYFGPLGLVQAVMGKREEADAERKKLEARLNALPAGTPPTAPIIACLVLMACALDERERIRHFYTDLLAFQGQHYWFLIDRLLGVLAAASGEWEVAIGHLMAAEATARREDLLPELARTLLILAEVEVERAGRGSSGRARDYLNQALELFIKLQMHTSIHHTQNRLHALAGRPADPTPSSLPANLTPHQALILKLVAQGKSNREVAEELGLSQKTVNNQLSTIYFKTKTQNRAEATAFAVRNGLA